MKDSGVPDSDEVIQCYLKQPEATVPVPQVRLAAFHRAFIKAGETVAVQLVVTPAARGVVLAGPKGGDATGAAVFAAASSRAVEAGVIEVHCGGGQPDFFEGSVMTNVTVTSSRPLSACS